jgi:hypothetical protein
MERSGELSAGKSTAGKWSAVVKRSMDAANRDDLATYTSVIMDREKDGVCSLFSLLGCRDYSFHFLSPECVVFRNPNCTLLPSNLPLSLSVP